MPAHAHSRFEVRSNPFLVMDAAFGCSEDELVRRALTLTTPELHGLIKSMRHPLTRAIKKCKDSAVAFLLDHMKDRYAALIRDPPPERVADILQREYTLLYNALIQPARRKKSEYSDENEYRRALRREKGVRAADATTSSFRRIESEWPKIQDRKIIYECCKDYFNATRYVIPDECAVCARRRSGVKMYDIAVRSDREAPLNFSLLTLRDTTYFQRFSSEFHHVNQALNGLILSKDAIHRGDAAGTDKVKVCNDCHSSLSLKKIPRLSLRNGLYRGKLPDEFSDLTWIEEMVCAIYRTTAHVTRLFQSSNPANSLVFHGNTCAHDTNVVSTASVLPRTPADVLGQLSVVFVGPGPPKKEHLRSIFRIRRAKVRKFLCWLKENNRLYMPLEISTANLALYDEDDVLPGLVDAVIVDTDTKVDSAFKEETAGIDEHPAELLSSQPSAGPVVMLESMGVSDPEGDKIPGRAYVASALKNLIVPSDSKEAPDLIIPRGTKPISEYNNPDLFPGMFPTLFPYGIGGFEDPERPVKLSFQKQAEYYLDIADKSFRYHRYFIFVALNIIQRRAAHLNTYFTVRRDNFEEVAQRLVHLSPELIDSVSRHLEHEGKYSDLNQQQKEVLDLLSRVNTIAAKIPGSHASKICDRNSMRAYMGYFGIGHIYLTLNPNPVHSPIFQVFFGDREVDLSSRFPQLVSPSERALRLAKDPVAAADFFNFVINAFLEHLLGWDFENNRSSERGGLLGHVRAFFGTGEYYERGSLHGHFVIWLRGGLNPSELHQKLAESVDFQKQFFDFFEDIIHHHLPDIDVSVDPGFDPRTQRPPLPSDEDWDSIFASEVKKCGEFLQRHFCRPVCHKYNHPDDCRFLFPHEEVKASYFDPKTNSIVLLCLDGTVNYFNPYILVFCRHNHDIKCILSGKAAKAAMFYITDYITKMDVKTYEMLSLLSRTVVGVSSAKDNNSIKDQARHLLHKCLSQFTRQQQIHAQQAVRYIRNLGDSIASHTTAPILSSLAMIYARRQLQQLGLWNFSDHCSGEDQCGTGSDSFQESSKNSGSDDNDVEEPNLKINIREDGSLCNVNQIDDYYYRDASLANMCLYDFVQCIRKERKSEHPISQRLGVYQRHSLLAPHPESNTHELVQHSRPETVELGKEVIPRILGCSIPRESSAQYHLFVLVHFKPWGVETALLHRGQTTEAESRSFEFLPRHVTVMKNWESLYECQDERDAERMRKQDNLRKESKALTKSLSDSPNEVDLVNVDSTLPQAHTAQEKEVVATMARLSAAGWLEPPTGSSMEETDGANDLPDCLPHRLKDWDAAQARQEADIVRQRRNALNPEHQEPGLAVGETVIPSPDQFTHREDPFLVLPVPETSSITKNEGETLEELMKRISLEHSLNQEQFVAFKIASTRFVEILQAEGNGLSDKDKNDLALRMLMTGPGGTGKTHVVRALHAVMTAYGCSHRIRYLAPTGTAAALIDGTTIHSGLGIQIESKRKGKGGRNPGEDVEDYSVVVNPKKKKELREDWMNVLVVLIDEVSLLSLQLLCDLDHALRAAKEQNYVFGGMTVIFGGDFYQYPPVGGSPLYCPVAPNHSQTNSEIKRRLGRIAWKSITAVVFLEQQMRMASDPEYGAAVRRLRIRECNYEDVELFNSRVIKSFEHPGGIDMSTAENRDATAIVRTNLVRQAINNSKSRAETARNPASLVLCAAYDTIKKKPAEGHIKTRLLKANMSKDSEKALPGYVPLYNGMPVILRARNISTNLKITNGSQGRVRKIETTCDKDGLRFASCVLVEFPSSTVQLPELPDRHYPIRPIKWTFSAVTDAENGKGTRITRSQLPIQPAFAVTGHSAQRKTLPKVLLDLAEGGFAAYVGASRARSRDGLCILRPVTLDKLNKPLPPELKQEMRRLEALAYNTQIEFGFREGELMPVPDWEFEKSTLAFRLCSADAMEEKDKTRTGQRKRKIKNSDDLPLHDFPEKKARLTVTARMTKADPPAPASYAATNECQSSTSLSRTGCSWDSRDYSCAYDATFMAFYSIYVSASPLWRATFRLSSNSAEILGTAFEHLITAVHPSTEMFNNHRNTWRDWLSSHNAVLFRRRGRVLCSVDAILSVLATQSDGMHRVITTCQCGTSFSTATSPSFLLSLSLWKANATRTGLSPTATSASIRTWCRVILRSLETISCECGHPSPVSSLFMASLPWICFEISPDAAPRPIPSLEVSFPSVQGPLTYQLQAAIYLSDNHFSTRILDHGRDRIWVHDGMENNGQLTLDRSITSFRTSDLNVLSMLRGRPVAFLLYSLTRESP